jgi:hypothetical protein
MDKQEARDLLTEELERYRTQTWQQPQRLLKTSDRSEVKRPSGTTYQVVIHAHWDDRGPGGDLRVLGAIDDRSFWRAVNPLCEDFIMAPDGKFVGEPGRHAGTWFSTSVRVRSLAGVRDVGGVS